MRIITSFPSDGFITVVKKRIPVRAIQIKEPFRVASLEGLVTGKAGDYLMEGVEKELYIHDKNIFDKVYLPFTKEYKTPAVTVDIIAVAKHHYRADEVILIMRKNEPFRDAWALPGGYINYGKETLRRAAVREFKEETNITISESELVLVGEYSNPKRDPRGHTITIAFAVTLNKKQVARMKAKDDASDIGLFGDKMPIPELAFDHAQILFDAKELLHEIDERHEHNYW